MNHLTDTCSAPGWCVAISSEGWGGGPCTLLVHRTRDLPNKWGGRGVSHYGDGNGKEFPTSEAAWAYALSRGYLMHFVKKDHPTLNPKKSYELRCFLRKKKGLPRWWTDEKKATPKPSNWQRF